MPKEKQIKTENNTDSLINNLEKFHKNNSQIDNKPANKDHSPNEKRTMSLQKSNIQNFKDQLKYQNFYWHQPSIIDNVFLESASTLCHTSGPQHLIPQGNRFLHYKKASDFQYNPKSTLSNISCVFKNNNEKRELLQNTINQYVTENAKNNPAPNNYMQLSTFDNLKNNPLNNGYQQGRSFLREWDRYKAMYIPEFHQGKVKKYEPCVQKHSVGPGKYDYQEEIGSNKPQYSLRDRTYIYQDKPTPGFKYQVKRELTELNRSADVTLKKSNRIDLAKPLNDNPGPGNYQINGCFDKFKQLQNLSILPQKSISTFKRSNLINLQTWKP